MGRSFGARRHLLILRELAREPPRTAHLFIIIGSRRSARCFNLDAAASGRAN